MSKLVFSFVLLLALISCNSNDSSKVSKKQSVQYYSRRYSNAKNNINSKNCKIIKPDIGSLKTISVETETSSQKALFFFKNIGEVRFVALQTRQDCLIDGINEILFASDRIFCVSNINQKRITIFNERGEFINKIEAIGKGPDEYMSISRVHIDYMNSNIVLFDYNSKKLLRYDYNGKHVSTSEVFFHFSDFIFSKKSDHIFFSSDSENNMHIDHISNKRIICAKGERELIYASLYLPEEYVFARYGISNFSYYNDTVLYLPNFSDTIYSLDSHKVTARYKIKHKGNNLKLENCNIKYFDSYNQNGINDNLFHLIRPILETKNYAYINFEQGMNSFHSLYNKKLNITETGFMIASDPNIAPIYGYPVAVYNDCFISTIAAERMLTALKNNIISNEYLDGHLDLKRIVKNLTINDNPIIMFSKPL